MEYVYGVCAVLGGSVVVWQFITTLIGVGHDDFSTAEVHDFGGADGDFAHDLHVGDSDHGMGETAEHAGVDSHSAPHHSSTWFFAVISFRTVVAALAFFGLTGLAMNAYPDSSPTMTFGVALATGIAAMYGVHWLMRSIASLRSEGTVRIGHAVGETGTVYLRIPSSGSGTGKIQIKLQNRTVELQALTEGEALPTGATIVVVSVVNSDTVRVARAPETAQVTHV